MTTSPDPALPGIVVPTVDPIGGFVGVPLVIDLTEDPRTPDERTLASLLEGEHVVMLVTADGPVLTSRPLTLAEVDGSVVRFIVDTDAPWLANAQGGAIANASVSDERHGRWISICGRTTVTTERSEVDRLWSGTAEVFFPDGRDTAAVLVLEATSAEWWDTGGSVKRFAHLVKAMVTHDAGDAGRHGQLDLRGTGAATVTHPGPTDGGSTEGTPTGQ